MSETIKKTILSMLPDGSAWTVAIGKDLDKFYSGKAASYQDIYDLLLSLSNIRNPQLTPVLDDLEREYGISINSALTETQRRDYLDSIVYGGKRVVSPLELQNRLQQAGFNVMVHSNDPAIDPQTILDRSFRMVCGGANAYAGRPDAFARRTGGELIVNGDKFFQRPNYTVVCGGANAYAGNASFSAGRFDGFDTIQIQHPVPTNPGDWPLVFFIGGAATRDMDGRITSIDAISAPSQLRQEFLKIVLKYKPLYTWCVSVVDFT